MSPASPTSASPEVAADEALRAIRVLQTASTPALRRIRRQWSAALKSWTPGDVLRFAARLLDEPAWPARLIAYEVVACHAPAFAALNDRRIEAMAKSLSDWGSIDLFGVTISGPAWLAGTLSTPRVQAWTRSRDKWRRRLALVSTVALNVSSRGGRGDAARTLRICARLVRDRDPAIVKALSWALRALAKREPQAVKKFIAAQRELLAALVQREVRNVLESGTKRPAKPRSARV